MDNSPKTGVFICHCGKNIAGTVNIPELAESARSLPGVAFVDASLYACSEPGQKAIRQAIAEHGLNRVVVAACSPRMHEPTFMACVAEAGLNPALLEVANIREGCSWVHLREPERATAKARDLVRMAAGKARLLAPIPETRFPVRKAAMVVGGGIAGIQAALDMADAGLKVYLVERQSCLGGTMAQLNKTYPTMDCAI
ncbi:CoB--CoM heterodisulfide reductase iron-sulfur subunit A family protein [candidate division WOR-3 bacterium]|nr:CoB--CoM heterodisulfide reductase iron-sulfur subunit A family protein [candidate division WOR-3 bacterium]